DIAPAIPQEVALGYHDCFGTLSGWPSRQPPDLGGTVMLLNAAIAASGRRVDFLHLPTLGTADDAFFAPLERLQAPDAKVYLGAIQHDADGLRRQLQTARRHLAEFGSTSSCATTSTRSSCSMRQGDDVPDGRGCGADRGGTAHRAARARLPRRG